MELGVQNETRQDWNKQSCQNSINHLWSEGTPHPLLYHRGRNWGTWTRGGRGRKRKERHLQASCRHYVPRVGSIWGKEITWPTWNPVIISTIRWEAGCPAWGQEPVCFPTARSPFHFSPHINKLHFSMICCHEGIEKPSQTWPDQGALGQLHSHAHVNRGAVWVSLLQSGPKSHRRAAAFSSLSFSVLASKGSQRVSAGCPGWADFPRDLTRLVLCVLISRSMLHKYSCTPQKQSSSKVVSDTKQSEKAKKVPHRMSLKAGLWFR